MKPVDAHPYLARMVRVLRLIVFLIAGGLAVFLGVVAYLHFGKGQDMPPEGAPLLTNVSLAVAGITILVLTLLRSSLVRAACTAWRDKDVQAFMRKYATGVIAGVAGIEGAGLLLAVAFLIEKDVMALTAGCVCLLLILFSIPSRNRVDALLEMFS